MLLRICVIVAMLVLPLGGAARAQATGPAARPGFFYVGGSYGGPPGKELMHGQMYVEVRRPARARHRYPLVFFHGAAQTGTNWLGTPDGRPGWADYFVDQGWTVYLVDQPARGRSPWQPGLDGELATFSAPVVERLFTAPEAFGLWPQAKLHTQWPGSGRRGDPAFDAFYATQVPYLASNAETQRLTQAAGAALLDRIGPAILVTHSQAGAFGWLLADARPGAVRGILALEPFGPPFQDAVFGTGPARAWGLTDVPLTYEPAVTDPAELHPVQQDAPDGPDLARCRLQPEPARRLPNLARVPVLLVVSEASYHAVYDHCTARYLQQAGVPVSLFRLAEHGVHGNGHMMMLERNSAQIARLLGGWLNDLR